MYLRVHGSQESKNKSLKKSNFILFFPSFSYKTLVKNSLPTKALIGLIYTQNNIAFAVVVTLTSYAFKLARVAVFTGRFHWRLLGAGSDCPSCMCSSHATYVAFFVGGGCVRSAYSGSLSIPPSGGSPLLGEITTNLFLSRFVVSVP